MIRSPDRYNRSRRFGDQTGSVAPLAEMSTLRPSVGDFGGNALTYTSGCPDSFDVYAIHFPSGENIASAFVNFVSRNRSGVPAFSPALVCSMATVQICGKASISRYARCLPSRANDVGIRPPFADVSNCGGPEASAGTEYIPGPFPAPA